MEIDRGYWSDPSQWPDDVHENIGGTQLTFVSLVRVVADAIPSLRSTKWNGTEAPDRFVKTTRAVAQWCEASQPPTAMTRLEPNDRAGLTCAAMMWPLDRSIWLMPREAWRGANWHPFFFRGDINTHNPHRQRWMRRRGLVSLVQARTQRAVEEDCPIFIERESSQALLKSLSTERTTSASVGAPEGYDWDEAEAFVMQQLETRGDPTDQKNQVSGWRRREDIARAVIVHLEKRLGEGKGPDPRTVRPRITGWLTRFRENETARN